ncbi:aminotransferase class V-fold PLP-dependent enzyme [Erwinia sp. V71]|uniref:aminotransferase class V-fold PLP-dependent enzyme n=1 Tax=Erwinia sp. V71 TaxID=3369424 RepID=UPI003F5DA0DD
MNIQGLSPNSKTSTAGRNVDNHTANICGAYCALLPPPEPSRMLTRRLRDAMLAIAGCNRHWSAIPLQGSGAFAVEAMLCTLLSATDHLLIVTNGESADRMTEIAHIHHIRYSVLALDKQRGIDLARVAESLAQDHTITHIAAVHFETQLGVKNDIDALERLATQYGCRLLVDISATFGVLPVNFTVPGLAAAALSVSQCLHGAPGMAFVLVRHNELTPSAPPRVFSLDLKAQYLALKDHGQWRFTSPLQVMQALQDAIDAYQHQGGREARFQLYCQRMIYLLKGMAAAGFQPLVEPQYCAPLFVTLVTQQRIDFSVLHDHLSWLQTPLSINRNGASSLRIGIQGEMNFSDIDDLLAVIRAMIASTSRLTRPPVISD